MRRPSAAPIHGEQGFVLVSALAIMLVVLGLGAALLMLTNGQERAGANQQQHETAFSLAEAALNAQIYELSLKWPTSSDAPQPATLPTLGYPTSCNTAMAGSSYCPSSADLSSYSPGTETCPAGTPTDAWSSSPAANGWTTYVRDAGPVGSETQQTFDSAAEETQPAYDSSATGYLWVRAVGVVHCRMAVVVAKVANQVVGLSVPSTVLDANGFELSNNGNHDTRTILNTQGVSPSPSQVSVRCSGTTPTTYPPSCVTMNTASQFGPTSPSSSSSWESPPIGSPAFSQQQLQQAKQMAETVGRYYGSPADCSSITDMSQLSGEVVYIEGGNSTTPCNIGVSNLKGNTDNANSVDLPGLLVLVNGTIKFTGGGTFYGVIYAVNQQGCPTGSKTTCPEGSDVVTLGGTATVVGGIDVDGNGTVSLGSSGNGVVLNGVSQTGDLIYNSSVFSLLQGYGGAAATPNTFSQLPNDQ